MRVKLSRIPKALKARRSKAQGEGPRAVCSFTLVLGWDSVKPCKGRHRLQNFFTSIKYCFALLIENDLQKPASPLQGFLSLRSNPGLRPLCGLRRGFAMPRFQRLG